MLALEHIGIGLRPPHYKDLLTQLPEIGWVEIHSENFFAQGGLQLHFLRQVAEHYPISLHGVGLSLGSAELVSDLHLERLASLAELIQPKFISEHLSFGYIDGVYMPDLLPVPYNEVSFLAFKRNITKTQQTLNRQILIENPSTYIEYHNSVINEADFLVDLCRATGSGILLDINNIFVSATNHGWDAKAYIDAIPANLVQELHLAGHSPKYLSNNQKLLIDTHDTPICPEVWDLYYYALTKFGTVPTLLEWDQNLPDLHDLILEVKKCML